MILNLTNFSSEPIHDQIVSQVLLRILEKEKLPGDELEPINKISRKYHIGQASIKKAFNKLQKLGAINLFQNKKYIVSDISEENLKNLLKENSHREHSFAENEILIKELEAARQIQAGLLPNYLPNDEFIEVSAYTTISHDVGGDFYDFFEIDNNKYGILIGDACGKGLPAALLVSQIQAIIKSDSKQKRSLSETFSIINSYLKSNSASKHFATLFYGVFDIEKKQINYVNAGHNHPIILNIELQIARLETTGPALGIMKNAIFQERVKNFCDGDQIFFFTDGLSERMNNSGMLFGENRIINLLKQLSKNNSKQIIDAMKEEVAGFSKMNGKIDDTTFLIIQIKREMAN